MRVGNVPVVPLVVFVAATVPILFLIFFSGILAFFSLIFTSALVCVLPFLKKHRSHDHFRWVICGYIASILILSEALYIFVPELFFQKFYYLLASFFPETERRFHVYADYGRDLYALSRLAVCTIVQFSCFVLASFFFCVLPFRYTEFVYSKKIHERIKSEGRNEFVKAVVLSIFITIPMFLFWIGPSFLSIGHIIEDRSDRYLMLSGFYSLFMAFYVMLGFELIFGGAMILLSKQSTYQKTLR